MFSLLLISVYTVKDFSTPHPTPPAMRLGLQRNWEGAQPGQLIPLTKVVSHTIQHHAQHAKRRERRRKGECLQQWCLPSLTTTCYLWWSLVFLGMAKHLPADEKGSMNSVLLCLYVWLLLYLIPQVFWHFRFSPPLHQRGASGCPVLRHWLGLK